MSTPEPADLNYLNYLAAWCYANGHDPLRVAEMRVTTLLEVHAAITERGSATPLPAWSDLSRDALARKIVGDLLDAGWTPPDEATLAAAWVGSGP